MNSSFFCQRQIGVNISGVTCNGKIINSRLYKNYATSRKDFISGHNCNELIVEKHFITHQ